jgi:iron complex transport system ATP-binding protein
MAGQQPLLRTGMLMVGYQSGKSGYKVVSGPLNLELYAGQLICLLGPNGSGKSTLLRTVSGLQDALAGTIELAGQNLRQMKAAEIARQISLVLTDNVRSGNLDVYSLIALGRYPYSGWLGRLNQEDKKAIDHAVSLTGTSSFLNRKMDSLSDGECQKVMLARAIAQDTPLIIMDEPTAHLDLPSRIQLMRLLHRLARETGKAVLMSTHELDLALQVADQIWLMDNDGHLATGLPEELVLNGSFQRAFDKDGISFDRTTGTFPVHLSGEKKISVTGTGPAAFWTRKALTRKGFTLISVIETAAADPSSDGAQVINDRVAAVRITEEGGKPYWILDQNGVRSSFSSLPEFLEILASAGSND